jgi:hypothetical protein
VYDFVAHSCYAQWSSAAGPLSCPGVDGDKKGFVLRLASPKLEDGTVSSQAGLLTFPQMVDDGQVRSIFPAIAVQNGDHFKATVGCENGATQCLVLFRLEFRIGNGPVNTYWTYSEQYDGENSQIDVDLGLLAGQKVNFGLAVLANGTATDDRALWVAARIVHVQSPSTATPTTTPTATPTKTP